MIDKEVLIQVSTTFVAFIVFFIIAKKMFWTRFMQVIEDRQKKIHDEFGKIESMQKQVNALQADYQRRVAEIEAEARVKMQEAIAQGKQIATQIADQAKKDADALALKTQQNLAIEMDKARAELKAEVVKMTIGATEKIIRQKMDDATQRHMVSSFVEELARK
jgi:F-type H+-transporting ATPase subunit b